MRRSRCAAARRGVRSCWVQSRNATWATARMQCRWSAGSAGLIEKVFLGPADEKTNSKRKQDVPEMQPQLGTLPSRLGFIQLAEPTKLRAREDIFAALDFYKEARCLLWELLQSFGRIPEITMHTSKFFFAFAVWPAFVLGTLAILQSRATSCSTPVWCGLRVPWWKTANRRNSLEMERAF